MMMESNVLAAPIFEGSEKRIEVDFRLGPNSPLRGLRCIPRETLDELMTLARCCIVSSRGNEQMDAYVLSESSLFVYPTKWILKTCGTTRLLNAVPRLLEVARELGMEPRRCKYTRASFLFPENQPFPYTAFEHEVGFLDGHFGPMCANGGTAFVLGEPYQGLQWHVYLADDMQPLAAGFKPTYNLEFCMTDLGADAAAQFFRTDKFVSAEATTAETGIAALKPGAAVDDYVFEPCGYSMNGIGGSGLITIHVTPEAHQSYASVEFSGFGEDLGDPAQLLSQVVKVFAPGKVSVTLSVDKADLAELGAWSAGAWGALASLPAGFGLQGVASQVSPCGGKVSYVTLLADKLATPGSPITPLHHAASFLSVVTSDSDGNNSEQETA
ncbi:S-adenosylmethionine decarboxylase proenzyme [Tetrabaena socialis]|uniref:S-adenosylmethionine decarboxylase proenzyme n=1 Tax=Tetrabaena socialis TaxID=47790 RepID=A0A2J8AC79_9CHLO|nr:S-adenosylmethionine decarboxylase proenzyme [Tetrabaena socialis]|eukprot:PNH10116.1 S-adenosylmethionine decarboxylase proenzyme [Tetrabaena socialis]